MRFFRASLILLLLAFCGGGISSADESSGPAWQDEGHRKMVEVLRGITERAPKENPMLSEEHLQEAKALLNTPVKAEEIGQRISASYALANWSLDLGREKEALAYYEHCIALEQNAQNRAAPNVVAQLYYGLATCLLRMAETENCCARNNRESCILPIQGEGVHKDQTSARKAMGLFQQIASRTEASSRLHLKSRWLLNIAAMTVGEYPQGVPEQFRIPTTVFEPKGSSPRFWNVAKSAGVDTFSCSGGVVADDLDGDGFLDIIVSGYFPGDPVKVFRNNGVVGEIKFTDQTAESGLTGIFGGLNMVQADYDNDGRVDVFILRGAWIGASGTYPNSLLKNMSEPGKIRFTDVSMAAGLAGKADYPTQTASWADYDLDGDLDLFVGNETDNETIKAPCQFFQNQGDGTFQDIAPQMGMTNMGMTKAVIWGDYNDDRWPDLYLSNFGGENRLFVNRKGKEFKEVAKSLGVEKPVRSFPAWFWDIENDGDLDLFCSAYSSGVVQVASMAVGQKPTTEPLQLYRNNGEGTFEDVAAGAGIQLPFSTMGANFGDLDGNGFLDFYLGTGWPEYDEVTPNAMFLNIDGTKFEDITIAGGFGHLQKGHAVAFADFDHDGDQDVFQQMGGAVPGDQFFDALYENPGFGHDWVSLQLVGTTSNRSAIGTRIRVELTNAGKPRSIYRHVNSGGSFGANPLRQNIGLGKDAKILKVEVFWPKTGETQVFKNVPKGKFLRVTEGRKELKVED